MPRDIRSEVISFFFWSLRGTKSRSNLIGYRIYRHEWLAMTIMQTKGLSYNIDLECRSLLLQIKKFAISQSRNRENQKARNLFTNRFTLMVGFAKLSKSPMFPDFFTIIIYLNCLLIFVSNSPLVFLLLSFLRVFAIPIFGKNLPVTKFAMSLSIRNPKFYWDFSYRPSIFNHHDFRGPVTHGYSFITS